MFSLPKPERRLAGNTSPCRDAMARWEESERRRLELVGPFDEAETDLAAGRFTQYTQAGLPQLAEDLKQEEKVSSVQPPPQK
jgi:hypothetical protein